MKFSCILFLMAAGISVFWKFSYIIQSPIQVVCVSWWKDIRMFADILKHKYKSSFLFFVIFFSLYWIEYNDVTKLLRINHTSVQKGLVIFQPLSHHKKIRKIQNYSIFFPSFLPFLSVYQNFKTSRQQYSNRDLIHNMSLLVKASHRISRMQGDRSPCSHVLVKKN